MPLREDLTHLVKVCGGVLLQVACWLAFAALAHGQSATATLSGTVTDATGAIVPGAALDVKNQGTGLERRTRSDEQGRYAFPQLSPGRYTLTARQPGFVDVALDGLELRVNTTVAVPVRFEKVGAVSETVSVTAEALQVNTTDASVGNAFGTRPILQLPFNARNVAGLLSLQPGVTFLSDEPSSAAFQDRSNGAINGARSDQSNITLDGVDVNDQQSRFAFTSVLRNTLDSVQEFRVTTTGINADQGRSAGAQVALVTKSGSNELHGSTYWFHRNTITSANDFFGNRAGLARPKLIRNIFGASAGGPVTKNRLFLFGNYEGRRDASEEAVARRVPTLDYRAGTLKYARVGGGIGVLSPEDVRSRLDPLGIGQNQAFAAVLGQYPAPNDLSVGDGLNFSGHRFNAATPLRWNTYIARADLRLDETGKHNLFVRGNLQNDNRQGAPQFPGQQPNFVELANNKGLAVGYTATVSANTVGTFRYGFTRQGQETTGIQSDVLVWPYRDLDYPTGATRGLTVIVPVSTAAADVTHVRGRHTWQFGGVARVIRNDRRNYVNSFHEYLSTPGNWLQGGNSGFLTAVPDLNPNTAASFGNAVLGTLGSLTRVFSNYNFLIDGTQLPLGEPVRRRFGSEEYELYVQDTWRVSRALTIVGGLRWSLMPPVYETNGQQASVLPALSEWMYRRGALADAGRSQLEAGRLRFTAADAPGGLPLYPFHKKNLAPRLALAYSPQASSGWLSKLTGGPGRTSIRAGAGLYYDLFGYGIAQRLDANSFGLASRIDTRQAFYTLATAPRFTAINAIPAGQIAAAPAGGPGTPGDTYGFSTSADYGIVPPYSINLNFSVARELPGGLALDVGYVSRLSRRTLMPINTASATNLRDPQSGVTLHQVSNSLVDALERGAAPATVAPVAFWENLWPGAAGQGLTATQRVYQVFQRLRPDWGSVYTALDNNCDPACSVLGRNALTSPQFWTQETWSSFGNGNYHGLQVIVRKRFSHGVQFDANYTWSKSIDLSSGVERDGLRNEITVNVWDRKQNRAVSTFDMTHQFNTNWVAELPLGRGRLLLGGANSVVNAVLGGWQVSGVMRVSSGMPVHVLSNGGTVTFGDSAFATPLGTIPGVTTTKNAPGIPGGGPAMFADPVAAFRSFAPTRPGLAGPRNSIRGDGLFNIDLGIGKSFALPWESHALQFRAEAFNVTNTPTFAALGYAPVSLGSPVTFGAYTRTLTPARVVQFGLRYEF